MALEWAERHDYARDAMLPWVERVAPLEGRRVIEFGCGNGPVTCAIAERGAEVLALDIDRAAVEEGQSRAREIGFEPEFVSGAFESLLERVERSGGADLFFLFAVLEHMTIDERLSTLAAAHRAIGRDGFIVVCETPNRLLPWDYHTSQVPFFGFLPDELALRCLYQSDRTDFREDVADGLTQSTEVARERLIRWGRGVSFHEFELTCADFPNRVVACNYEPELLSVRELYPEELNLARLLKHVRPDIPPSFTRYWIDVVIAGNSGRPARYFEPWPFETTNSIGVDLTEWDCLLLRGPGSKLRARMDHPSGALVVGLQNHVQPIELRIGGDEFEPITFRVEAAGQGVPVYTTVRLPRLVEAVTVEVSDTAVLNFLGLQRVVDRQHAHDG